jgi:hypothetical protein
MTAIQVLLALVEGIVAVASSAICCRATCCRSNAKAGQVFFQGQQQPAAAQIEMGGFPGLNQPIIMPKNEEVKRQGEIFIMTALSNNLPF